jgi:hypothetical protein
VVRITQQNRIVSFSWTTFSSAIFCCQNIIVNFSLLNSILLWLSNLNKNQKKILNVLRDTFLSQFYERPVFFNELLARKAWLYPIYSNLSLFYFWGVMNLIWTAIYHMFCAELQSIQYGFWPQISSLDVSLFLMFREAVLRWYQTIYLKSWNMIAEENSTMICDVEYII